LRRCGIERQVELQHLTRARQECRHAADAIDQEVAPQQGGGAARLIVQVENFATSLAIEKVIRAPRVISN
jgi:hypothetical protein